MDERYSRMDDIEDDASPVDEAAYWLEADFVLSEIVSQMVNMMQIPLGITLFLKGAVVTGMLVSEHEYLSELSNTFFETAKRNLPIQDEAEIRNAEQAFDFRRLAEDVRAPLIRRMLAGLEDYDDENDDLDLDEQDLHTPEPIRYLHLRDMVVLTPSPSLNFAQGVLPIVRIRLTSIDGWLLGQATPVDLFEEDDSADSSGEVLH